MGNLASFGTWVGARVYNNEHWFYVSHRMFIQFNKNCKINNFIKEIFRKMWNFFKINWHILEAITCNKYHWCPVVWWILKISTTVTIAQPSMSNNTAYVNRSWMSSCKHKNCRHIFILFKLASIGYKWGDTVRRKMFRDEGKRWPGGKESMDVNMVRSWMQNGLPLTPTALT